MNHAPARISDIQRETATAYGLRVADLKGKDKFSHIALPRQIAMYLCRVHTNHSYKSIADHFNREHTTVIHAVQKIHGLISKSLAMRSQVMYLSHRVCPNEVVSTVDTAGSLDAGKQAQTRKPGVLIG